MIAFIFLFVAYSHSYHLFSCPSPTVPLQPQALRRVNNNPEYYSPQKRLVVEFTLENMAKVKIHEAKKKQQEKVGVR